MFSNLARNTPLGDNDDDDGGLQIAVQVSPIGAQLSPNPPNCATKSSNMSQKHQIPRVAAFMSPAIW